MQIFPSFTVVVCTHNRPAELDRCLRSLRKLSYPNFDVLVVDSAPHDGTAAEIASRNHARYLVEPIPGVSRARNLGARACTSSAIAFLDDEAIADPGWLRGLAREFEDPQVMAVAGRIQSIPGSQPDLEEARLCAVLGGADCGGDWRAIDHLTPHWFERASFGGLGNGGNLAFRRSAFEVWPGFCESLGAGARIAGGEEHYAFFQLVNLGYRVVYTPAAVVRHPVPSSLHAVRTRHRRYLAASAGYLALFFAEQPRYRSQILKYVFEAACGVPRGWRDESTPRVRAVVSPYRILQALLAGVTNFCLEMLIPHKPLPSPQPSSPRKIAPQREHVLRTPSLAAGARRQ